VPKVAPGGIVVGGASRPYPGETHNGDAWRVDWQANGCRISLIDGLGHGPEAARAAQAALDALEAHPDLAPEASLRACHLALGHTRGAAISVARITADGAHLEFCGVGNAEGVLLHASGREHMITYRGIVGATLPRLRTFTHVLPAGWLLAMFTDGVRSRFQVDGVSTRIDADLTTAAESILATWARPTDDATVLLAYAPGS